MSKWSEEHKKAAIARYKSKLKKSKRVMKNPINSVLKQKIFAEIKLILKTEIRWHFGQAVADELIERNPEFAELNKNNGKAFRLGALHQILKYLRENNLVEFKKIGSQTFYKYSDKLETLK